MEMISIEIASIADIEELTRVEIASKLQSLPEYMDEVAIDYVTRLYRWRTYFDGESPASSKPERIVFKAVKDGQMVGFIAGHLTNRHKDSEIQNFYILKEHQRKGIGSDLLTNLLPWLIGHGAKSLCVGIFPENPYQAFTLNMAAHTSIPIGFFGTICTCFKIRSAVKLSFRSPN